MLFDAPVSLFVTLDHRLDAGSYMDLGMFVQNIFLMAHAHGLHSCPQVSFSQFHKAIRAHLPLAKSDILVCAVALGYEDSDAPENQIRTPRVPVKNLRNSTVSNLDA